MAGVKRKLCMVALTEEKPEEDCRQMSVVFGDHVRPAAARRSEILTHHESTDIISELPGRLSPDEIRLWQAACLLECEPSTSELVTILKVADVLGDSHIAAWVDMFSKRIMPSRWADRDAATALQCSLLQLPSHLLSRVLAACLATHRLDALLSAFPATLHPSLVSICASAGAITLPHTLPHLDTVLSCLAITSCPPPGLLSVDLPSTYCEGMESDTHAALLARALSAHPSLTSLGLHQFVLPVSYFRQLGLGLAHTALPNLVSLHLCTEVFPDGCAELARCLRHLSALIFLHAELYFEDRLPAASSLGAYVSIAASPARLVNLKELVVDEGHHIDRRKLHSSSRSVSHRLFPLLATPNLTSLTFFSDVVRGSTPVLLQSLRHMTSLQELHVDADMKSEDALATASMHAGGSGGEGLLPQLHTLAITSACAVAPVAMAAAVTAASHGALTRLHIEHEHVSDRMLDAAEHAPPGPEGVQKAWADLLRSLSLCGNLRDLQLACLCNRCDEVIDGGFGGRLCSALRQLPLLTRLRLEAACRQCAPGALCQLHGEPLGTALWEMTDLQSLAVCGAAEALTVTCSERVLHALPRLQQLTSLALGFPGLQQSQIATLMKQSRAVKECEVLAAALGENAEQVGAFRARFPGVAFRIYGDAG